MKINRMQMTTAALMLMSTLTLTGCGEKKHEHLIVKMELFFTEFKTQ